MRINVMSWNMAGAKMLEHLDPPTDPVAKSYISAYRHVWLKGITPYLSSPRKIHPDIILLQECIGFTDTSIDPSGRWGKGQSILSEIFQGYKCYFFPAVTSHENPHPAKWLKYQQGGDVENFIPPYINIQQGYGICIKEGIQPRTLWIASKCWEETFNDADKPDRDATLCFEPISITTGLYQGDRDTEPRKAILGRVLLSSGSEKRYVNFLNVHLNTLKGEREGSIRLNRTAGQSRLVQIDLLLNNVVSAYQEARTYRVPVRGDNRKEDIWIIGGDFNATPDSEEISLIKRMGFVDGHEKSEQKEIEDQNSDSPYHGKVGTKWSLKSRSAPPIALDYIFCGLERVAFPAGKLNTHDSKKPFRPLFPREEFESDHAVLFASFGI